MPNNRRGYGGVKSYAWTAANGEAYDTLVLYDIPDEIDNVPIGGLWKDGNTIKIVGPDGTELLTNGAFETGSLSPWTTSSATWSSISSAGNYTEGAKSMQVYLTGALGCIIQSVTLTVGHRYILSANVKPTVGIARIDVKNVSSGLIEKMETADDLGQWSELSIDFVAAATSYQIRIGGIETTATAYFDEVSLQEVA